MVNYPCSGGAFFHVWLVPRSTSRGLEVVLRRRRWLAPFSPDARLYFPRKRKFKQKQAAFSSDIAITIWLSLLTCPYNSAFCRFAPLSARYVSSLSLSRGERLAGDLGFQYTLDVLSCDICLRRENNKNTGCSRIARESAPRLCSVSRSPWLPFCAIIIGAVFLCAADTPSHYLCFFPSTFTTL